MVISSFLEIILLWILESLKTLDEDEDPGADQTSTYGTRLDALGVPWWSGLVMVSYRGSASVVVVVYWC